MSGTVWHLSELQLREWLDKLLGDGYSVVAPVREDGILLFGRIESADLAVLSPSGKARWSPKEFVFPRSETLYAYTVNGGTVRLSEPPSQGERQVLFGVRPCDAAGLARLDDAFLGGAPDPLYAARRGLTTVVSVACAEAEPECFCTAVSVSPVGAEGSDVQLAFVDGGWLVRSLTDKGATLIGAGSRQWPVASPAQQARVEALGARVTAQIGTRPVRREWGALLEQGFDQAAWARAAERCLQCGTCAYVCPSCSCFDMNHEGNAWCGRQCRSWDACTFELFTRHASGHNPRPSKSDRYRQRVLHKFAFATPENGAFRCVGCGRCVALCPAGVNIVEAAQAVVAAVEEPEMQAAEVLNPYRPCLLRIGGVRPETPDVHTLTMRFVEPDDARAFPGWDPGQFGEFTVFGAGESVFAISNAPWRPKGANGAEPVIECTFRDVGKVTHSLRARTPGELIGFRGPYGNAFPIDSWRGRDLVFIGGGMGMAAIRSAILAVIARRADFGDVLILNGARTVADMVYKDEMNEWASRPGVRVVRTVDPGGEAPGWDGKIGLIPQVFEEVGLQPDGRVVIACGPPIMLHFLFKSLEKMRFAPEQVVTTLENKMKCGIGICGRCSVGPFYVCRDGPVVTWAKLNELPRDF